MMFLLITPDRYHHFSEQINEMFALRYRVFCERLRWVEGKAGWERDDFDELSPTYLIYQSTSGHVAACARLLPTTGPNMLANTFPQLLNGEDMPRTEDRWESSRFAVDTFALKGKGKTELSNVSSQFFLAMIEFGLSRRLKEIVTVTDLRVERIVRSSGWRTRRLGDPQKIGSTRAVAIAGEISKDAWKSVRNRTQVNDPVLFQSVI